ncbi:NtaA/DmoA family FMN-dependent monooxygenase [Streptomyces sp. NPDC006602]|uniref:NtaA/DmoA family FMN-dependent monooxygenase n=1 Tax=Streptomyces sp. NPDC006602 TaxID=3364751 RepID=UPI00368C372D
MTVRQRSTRKRIHLAAHLPGVDNPTVRADPRSRSQIEFPSYEHLAHTAERGLFDFFLLAEGLRPSEDEGRIRDLDVVGRPEALTVLGALAGVTDRLGLAVTLNATFHEPYELARRLATLDHLSGGRAAWNVVVSSAFTGENFRRGGYLDRADDAYARAAEFVAAVRELWGSWTPDGVPRPFAHQGRHFDIAGEFGLPRSPQGHPVVIQAADSEEEREFAAATADVIFSRHGSLEAGRAFYADVKGRLAKYGRTSDDLKIMPGVTVVLGDTAAEARERAAGIQRQQVSPRNALRTPEWISDVDLSSHDPDGPLPETGPVAEPAITQERTRRADSVAVAEKGLPPLGRTREWGSPVPAKAQGLSIRQAVIEAGGGRQPFVGTPETVAAELDLIVRRDAADGFVLVPHLTPGGLDEFVDRVVPLLQERGAFRTEYEGTTLRSHLGLTDPVGKG